VSNQSNYLFLLGCHLEKYLKKQDIFNLSPLQLVWFEPKSSNFHMSWLWHNNSADCPRELIILTNFQVKSSIYLSRYCGICFTAEHMQD